MNSHIVFKKVTSASLIVFIGILFLSISHVTLADVDSATSASTTPDVVLVPTYAGATPATTSTGTSTPESIASTALVTASTTVTATDFGTPISSTTPSTDTSSSTPTIASSTLSSPTTGTATITVRDGSVLAWTGTVSFPIGTSTSLVAPTNSSSTVPVLDQSLLGSLLHLQNSESGFSISNLAYYPSFGEFLINCVSVPATGSAPNCYNWQYEVNGVYPYSGIDQYILQNGDNVYLYFGNPREVVTATSTVSAGQSFVATAESYDPTTNTYIPLTGYIIGVTQPDLNNPYSPTEIATSSVDSAGNATFTISTPGTYGLGLSEDYYSNLTPLTVTATATTTATSTDGSNSVNGTSNNSGVSSGSSSGNNTTSSQGNIPSAFSYLVSQQGADGSFAGGDSGISDWVALALALPDAPQSARAKLASYVTTNTTSLSSTLDYERHALALEALKINPYSGSSVNVISPVVKTFSGTSAASEAANTDIFALITLTHAGYATTDPLIQKISTALIGKQASNGSWFGGNVDLTAAAIQALTPLPNTSSAVSKAESFLRSQQNSLGGFGNSDSTSWVLNTLASRGESPSNWSQGTSTPLTALASFQQTDGSNRNPSDVNQASWTWSTAYAITAYEGRSWSSLLGNFSLPAGSTATSVTVTSGGSATSTEATSTLATLDATDATTTLSTIATTTLPLLPTYIIPIKKLDMGSSILVSPEKKPFSKAMNTSNAALSWPAQDLTAGVSNAQGTHSFWETLLSMLSAIESFFQHLL